MRLNLLLLTIAITITSCIQDSETFTPNKNLGDIESLLNKLDYNSRTIAINPQIDNVIVTDLNEVILIPANSIYTEAHDLVTTTVEFTYAIYSNRALDIIKDRTLDSNLGHLSGWVNIELKFRQGGKRLVLIAENGVSIKIPYNNIGDNLNLSLFEWQNKIWTSVKEENGVAAANWKLETQNGTVFGTGYSVTIKRDGEFLVGTKSVVVGESEICVNLPENLSSQNTIAYIFFKDNKTSFKLNETLSGFCGVNLPNLKVGNIVCLSEQDGKYFIGQYTIRTNSDTNVTMVTKEMNLDEIKNFLATL